MGGMYEFCAETEAMVEEGDVEESLTLSCGEGYELELELELCDDVIFETTDDGYGNVRSQESCFFCSCCSFFT